MNIDIDI